MSDNKNEDKTVKIDAGKPPLSWLPRQPLLAVAEVMRNNQEPLGKYPRHGWRKGGKWSQILDAALRHLLAFQEGINRDEEDGALHIDHALWNLLVLSDWQHRQVGEDDRVVLPLPSTHFGTAELPSIDLELLRAMAMPPEPTPPPAPVPPQETPRKKKGIAPTALTRPVLCKENPVEPATVATAFFGTDRCP